MGLGGTGSTQQSTNPNTFYSPVSYGGNIISGDVGNGPIGITGQTTAEGGKFDFKLDMPMPMQLQNLDFFSDFGAGLSSAAKIGADAYKVGKQVAPVAGKLWEGADKESYNQYALPATDSFLSAKNAGKSVGGWNTLGQIGGAMNPTAKPAAAP